MPRIDPALYSLVVEDEPVRAVDADTLSVPGVAKDVRLGGYDAPETAKPWKGEPAQVLADLATQETETALARGARVQVSDDTDATGRRYLGRLIRADGEDQASYLIRNGLAAPTRWSTQDEANQELIGFTRSVLDDPLLWTDEERDLQARRAEALRAPSRLDLNPQPTDFNDNGVIGAAWDRGVDNMQSMLYAFGHAVGDKLGAEGFAEDMRKGMERNILEASVNPARVASWDDVTWGNVGTFALEAIVENLPNMGISLGAGLAAVASGGSSAPLTVAGAAAARAAAGKAAMRFALGSGAASYGLSAGEVQKELLEAGIDASGTALVAGIPMAALDAIGVTALAAPLLKTPVKSTALNLLEASGAKLWQEAVKGFGKGAALGTLEAPTEALQEIILLSARAYEDPSFELLSEENLKRVRDAAIKGGIAGSAIGGSVSAVAGSSRYLGDAQLASAVGITPDMSEERAAARYRNWQVDQDISRLRGVAARSPQSVVPTEEPPDGGASPEADPAAADATIWKQAYPQGNVRPPSPYRSADGWDEAVFEGYRTRLNSHRLAATGMHKKFSEQGQPTPGAVLRLYNARKDAISEARNALNYVRRFSSAETEETRALEDIIRQQEEKIAAEAQLFGSAPQDLRLIELTKNRASREGATPEAIHLQLMEAIPEATVEELEAFIANQKEREKQYGGESRALIRAEIAEAARYLKALRGEDPPTGDQDWDDFVERSYQAHRAASENPALSPEPTPSIVAEETQDQAPSPTSSVVAPEAESPAPGAEIPTPPSQSIPPTAVAETPGGQEMQGSGQEAPGVSDAPSTPTTSDQTQEVVLQVGSPAPDGVGQANPGVEGGQGLAVVPETEGTSAAPVLPPTEATAGSPAASGDLGAPGTTATNESQEPAAETSAPVVRSVDDATVGADLAAPDLYTVAREVLAPKVKRKNLANAPIAKSTFVKRFNALPAEKQAELKTLTGRDTPAAVYELLRAAFQAPSAETQAPSAETQAPSAETQAPSAPAPAQPTVSSVEPPANVEEALIDIALSIQDPVQRTEAYKILSEVYLAEGSRDEADETGVSAIEKGLRLEALMRKEAQVKRGEIPDMTEQEWDDLYNLPTLRQREFDTHEEADAAVRRAYEQITALVRQAPSAPPGSHVSESEPSVPSAEPETQAPSAEREVTDADVSAAIQTLPENLSAAHLDRIATVMNGGTRAQAMAAIEAVKQELGAQRQAPSTETTPETPAPSAEDQSAIEVWAGLGQNAHLSNLAERPFKDANGREYRSVEHAYQVWKSGSFDEEVDAQYRQAGKNPGKKGRKGTKTADNWNLRLMKRLMLQSFEQNPEAAEALLATGDRPFAHSRGDKVWREHFPRLLAEVRDELRAKRQAPSAETEIVDQSQPPYPAPAPGTTFAVTWDIKGKRVRKDGYVLVEALWIPPDSYSTQGFWQVLMRHPDTNKTYDGLFVRPDGRLSARGENTQFHLFDGLLEKSRAPSATPESESQALSAELKTETQAPSLPRPKPTLKGHPKFVSKDQGKSDQATHFIGRGAPGSSTDAYRKQWEAVAPDRVNQTSYPEGARVFVSINGNHPKRTPVPFAAIQNEVAAAVAAKATIIADAPSPDPSKPLWGRRDHPYNSGVKGIGEGALADYLEANGYEDVQGNGIWTPKAESRAETGIQAPSATPETEAAVIEEADPLAELARSGQIEDFQTLLDLLSQDLEAAYTRFLIDPKAPNAPLALIRAAKSAGYAAAGISPPVKTASRVLRLPAQAPKVQAPSAKEAPTATNELDQVLEEIEDFEEGYQDIETWLAERSAENEVRSAEMESSEESAEEIDGSYERQAAEQERAWLERTFPPKPVSVTVNVRHPGIEASRHAVDGSVAVMIGRLLQALGAEAGLEVRVNLAQGSLRKPVALDQFTWDLVNEDGWRLIDVTLEGEVEPDQFVLGGDPQEAFTALAEVFISGVNSPRNKLKLPVDPSRGLNRKEVAVNTVSIRRLGRKLRVAERVLSEETLAQAYLADLFEGLDAVGQALGINGFEVVSGNLVVEHSNGTRVTLQNLLDDIQDQAELYQEYTSVHRATSEVLDDYLYHAGRLEAEVDALWSQIEEVRRSGRTSREVREQLAEIQKEREALSAERRKSEQALEASSGAPLRGKMSPGEYAAAKAAQEVLRSKAAQQFRQASAELDVREQELLEQALDPRAKSQLKALFAKHKALREQIRPHEARFELYRALERALRAELKQQGVDVREEPVEADARHLALSANRERVTLKDWQDAEQALKAAESELAQAREAALSPREAVQAQRRVRSAERDVNAARQALRDLAARERAYRELREAEHYATERENREVSEALERGTYAPGLETEDRQARRSANEGQRQAQGPKRKARERKVEVEVKPTLAGHIYAHNTTVANRFAGVVNQVLRATGLQQDTVSDQDVSVTDQAGLSAVMGDIQALEKQLDGAVTTLRAALADPETSKAEKAQFKRMLAEREQDLAEARQTYKLLEEAQGMRNPARVIYNNGYATPALRQPIIVVSDKVRSGKVLPVLRSIAHEIGHVVQQVYLNRMSPEVRAALAWAFLADRPFSGAAEEAIRSKEFAEWFADQTVAYVAREAPKHEAGVAEFFQRLVRALRAAWRALRAQTQLNETFRQFLDAVNGYYAAEGEYRGSRFQNQVAESLMQSGRSPYLARRAEGEAPFANMAEGELPGQHEWSFIQRRRGEKIRTTISEALDTWKASPRRASLLDFGNWVQRNSIQTLASWFDARGPIMKEIGAHFYRRTDARGSNLGRGAPFETRNRQDYAHVWNTMVEPALTRTGLRKTRTTVNNLLDSDPGLDSRSPLYGAVLQALVRETPLNSIRDPEARAAVKELRGALAQVRGFLNKEYGLEVAERKDYWPVVVDLVRFQRDKDAIIQKLRNELKMSYSDAEAVWEDTVNSNGSIIELVEGQLVTETSKVVAPGFEWGKSRRWSPEIHRVLRDWQVDDLGGTLHRYVTAAVKRGVTQSMFGGVVEVVGRDGRVQRRMDPISRLNVELARARQAGELTAEEYRFATDVAIPALFGQLGLDANPGWRALSVWSVTYQNLRLLPFVIFSSFVDPALILNRGEVRATWHGLSALIRARGVEDAKTELRALGALRSDMTEAIVNDQLGGMFYGGTPQRINETFFRAVQMHRWTNWMRAWALNTGKRYLSDHARGAKRSALSAQRLRVLGVTPEQVAKWELAGSPVGDRRFAEINAALNQFIDDAVLRPHAALRAGWASDPRMMMFAYLKSFAWSFYERALRQVWTESLRRWGDEVGARKALALLPIVTLAVSAMALAMVGYELRRRIGWWNDVPEYLDKDGLGYVWELSQRAGFYGPLQFMLDAERAADQGNRVWLLSLLGPQVDQIQDVLSNGWDRLDKSVWRAIPGGLQQMPAARQWFDREVW